MGKFLFFVCFSVTISTSKDKSPMPPKRQDAAPLFTKDLCEERCSCRPEPGPDPY
jgi:hypothetical protein